MILDLLFELVEDGRIESNSKVVFLIGHHGPNNFDQEGSEADVNVFRCSTMPLSPNTSSDAAIVYCILIIVVYGPTAG